MLAIYARICYNIFEVEGFVLTSNINHQNLDLYSLLFSSERIRSFLVGGRYVINSIQIQK